MPATVTIDGIDATTECRAVSVGTPGVHSESRLSADGGVTFQVTGPTGSGRHGEPRVAKMLCARLRNEGHKAVPLKRGASKRHADDANEIDEVIEVDGKRYDVQVVRVPLEPALWQQTYHSSASREGDLHAAAKWLRASILRKGELKKPGGLAALVLAIDAYLVAVLADETVLNEYLAMFGDPKLEFGFASVWVVGPTLKTCSRLGAGDP